MPRRKYYQANLEYWRAYNLEYQRRWRKAHPELKAEYDKKYHKKVLQDPEKRKRWNAKAVINQAVSRGKLTKPKNCSICNATGRIEGHHDDYDKPLEVRWFCRLHHNAEHAKLKAQVI
jgi:hypothetical protein